jgi:hypothetical protein
MMPIITKKANDNSVARRIAAASILVAKTSEPIHVVRVDNRVIGDSSGYLGLILNVNANGKAIRIALRDGSQRVHVLKDEVENLVKALVELKANGVKTSVDDIEYDAIS